MAKARGGAPKKKGRKPTKKVAKKATTKRKSVKRTPPHPEWEAWSSAQYWSFLRSGLRSKHQRYPPRYAVLDAAKRPSESDNKRLKWEFQCNECKLWHQQKNVSVDHIIPCGSLKSYEDLPGFVQRLFVGVAGLQVLCKKCHDAKTLKDKEKGD